MSINGASPEILRNCRHCEIPHKKTLVSFAGMGADSGNEDVLHKAAPQIYLPKHTLKHLRGEQCFPRLISRDFFEAWAESKF